MPILIGHIYWHYTCIVDTAGKPTCRHPAITTLMTLPNMASLLVLSTCITQQKRCYYTGYTTSRTRCTHSYCLTRIETGKICFKSLVNSIVSIVCHFGLHRLIPKLHGSLSMLSKIAKQGGVTPIGPVLTTATAVKMRSSGHSTSEAPVKRSSSKLMPMTVKIDPHLLFCIKLQSGTRPNPDLAIRSTEAYNNCLHAQQPSSTELSS